MGDRSDVPFESASLIARWTMAFLITTLALSVLSIVFGLFQVELLSRIARGEGSISAVESNDSRQQLLGLIRIIVLIGTAVCFLAWLYRAYKNLVGLSARESNYSPGWAVAWFFVPIYNLTRPFRIMRELWRSSDPFYIEGELGKTPAQVIWWWALYLVSSLYSSFVA